MLRNENPRAMGRNLRGCGRSTLYDGLDIYQELFVLIVGAVPRPLLLEQHTLSGLCKRRCEANILDEVEGQMVC